MNDGVDAAFDGIVDDLLKCPVDVGLSLIDAGNGIEAGVGRESEMGVTRVDYPRTLPPFQDAGPSQVPRSGRLGM